MSHLLYRLGRLAARRPWAVIGTWLLVAVLVIGASAAAGRELDDGFGGSGFDSTKALDLMTAAQSEAAGPTAQVVMTPRDGTSTFFDSPSAVAAVADIERGLEGLPHVLDISDAGAALAGERNAAVASGAVSADGRVVLIRVQYDLIGELSKADLDRLKEFANDCRRRTAVADRAEWRSVLHVPRTGNQPR